MSQMVQNSIDASSVFQSERVHNANNTTKSVPTIA